MEEEVDSEVLRGRGKKRSGRRWEIESGDDDRVMIRISEQELRSERDIRRRNVRIERELNTMPGFGLSSSLFSQ